MVVASRSTIIYTVFFSDINMIEDNCRVFIYYVL